MTTNEGRCEPPPGKYVVHVSDDAGGIQWRGVRYRLNALTPPATVTALVEALEWQHWLLHAQRDSTAPIIAITQNNERRTAEKIISDARAALALYRGEAGR